MNDFVQDDVWQRMIRDTVLIPGFYKLHATRFVCVDRHRTAQGHWKPHGYSVDTIAHGDGGDIFERRIHGIEEKIVRDPGYVYKYYAIETESCTLPGLERPGWLYTSLADTFIYVFTRIVTFEKAPFFEVHVMSFERLKAYVLDENAHSPFLHFSMNSRNQTAGWLVPTIAVGRVMPVRVVRVYPDRSDPAYEQLLSSSVKASAQPQRQLAETDS